MWTTFQYLTTIEGTECKRSCLFPNIIPLKKEYDCHEASVLLAINDPSALFR